MADLPLDERVDEHFKKINLAFHDVNGMMRHILDSLGALKHRLSEEQTVSQPMISVFGNAAKTLIDHITGYELIDNESAVKFLVEAFPDESKKRDGRSWLPLHWAAALQNTEPEEIRAIIKERPIVAIKGHLNYTRPLNVEEETDENSYRGLLPLHLASSLKYPKLANVQTLITTNPKALALPDHRGYLPLHWCAYNCQVPEIMLALLRRDNEACFCPNKRGKLPFQMAAYNRCTELLDILVAENPECVLALDYNGNSPMHDAAKSFNHEAIYKLYEMNNSICRERNFNEQLPIHKAFSHIPAGNTRLQYRHLETIKALLACNPETASLPDASDSLPLHLAVFHNSSIDVVTELYNVYPSAALVRDANGKLPIQYVANAEVKRLLMKSSPPLVKAGITDSFARFVS